MAEVLDWRADAEPTPLPERLAAALRSGAVVAVPTESGYLLAASVLHNAFDRMTQLRPGEPVHLAAGGWEDVALWLRHRGRTADRFLRRLWPGPVSLALALDERDRNNLPELARERLIDARGRLRLGSFQHPFFTHLMMHLSVPIAFIELEPDTEVDPATLESWWGEQLEMIVADGPRRSERLTRIDVDGSNWTIEQHGTITEEAIRCAAGRWFVFVCTGNTCRSPMAEALFKTRLAQGLNCRVDELPARGYNVLSAGVATRGGDAAALDAIETAASYGADLSEHRSRGVSEPLVRSADHLIAMTRSHLVSLLHGHAPEGAMQLLCGAEGDLDDPIGGGADVYRDCARMILRHVDRLISEYQLL